MLNTWILYTYDILKMSLCCFQAYKKLVLSSWRALNLDAVICPGFGFPAVPHSKVMEVLGAYSYKWLHVIHRLSLAAPLI